MWHVTYPGGEPDPQQPYQQPYGPPPPYPQQYEQQPPHAQPQQYPQQYEQQPPHAQPQQYPQQYEQQQPYTQPIQGQPYAQPGRYAPQPDPYGQYAPQPYYGPPTGALPVPAGGGQRGGKWALLIGGGVLALILVVVGGYFTYHKVFVSTPTEVVEAFFKEATKAHPDPDVLARYVCKAEVDAMKRDFTGNEDATPSSTVLDWSVTGESIIGDTATVTASITVKSSSGRTSTNSTKVELLKEDGDWKICQFGD
jgi:hypothetical protein